MKTRVAICWAENTDWSVEEVKLREPEAGEVLVKLAFAGLCHSDEHVRMGDLSIPDEEGGYLLSPTPMVGGHEGAGVVEAIGEGVTKVAVGDHVAASFIPACGMCPPCSSGRQNLCDRGAETLQAEPRITAANGTEVRSMAGLGTFGEHMVVDQDSLVKVGEWYPLDAVTLVSCGVATGYGSAVNVADIRPGDTVVIVGVGGIGMNAVQGAKAAGAAQIIAVDPVEMKREFAQTVGATHTAASIEEATPLVNDLSWGRNANTVILTVGDATSDLFAPAMAMVGKGGELVLTSLSNVNQNNISMNTFDMTMSQKALKGNVFGGCNPRVDIPKLLRQYEAGQLRLDELITARYTLDQINEGYAAMHAGENVRGVIVF
jgi:S-(hydroxymethyl)glutathione dehydrogenase/alcohol dehydrogenase